MTRTHPRRAWNGGTVATAMAEARKRTEAAIASGCERCPECAGDGGMSRGPVCPTCGGAGFLVPPGGMPPHDTARPAGNDTGETTMGNHNIGRAFAAAAEAFWAGVPDGAATREMALAALDAAGAEYHRSDAEFDDELMDQTTPLGQLVALAFDATPGELVTEADDYNDDAWADGPVARFNAHFDFH